MKRAFAAAAAVIVLFLSGCAGSATPPVQAAPAQAPAATAATAAAQPAAAAAAIAPAPATPAATAAIAPLPAPDPLSFFAGAPPASRDAVKKAYELAEAGKWKSAFDSLKAFDPKKADPWVLAAMTRLALDGSVRTDLHQSFGFVDLEAGQTVDELRDTDLEIVLQPFDPPSLAEPLGVEAALPPILSKVLGDYFYDAQQRFAGEWIIADEEIKALSLANYETAWAAGVYDQGSVQNHGELLMAQQRAAEAEPLFAKAVQFDPENPAALYNLALSLLIEGKRAECLDIFDRAIAAIPSPESRFDAIALAARAAADLGDAVRGEQYLARADRDYPGNPSPLLLRHLVAVQHGAADAADAAADALAAGYGANPEVIRNIVSAWYSAGQAAAARAFLERNAAAASDDAVIGTLLFYDAILMLELAEDAAGRAAASTVLDRAEASMQKVFAPGDEVFGVIAQVRAQMAAAEAEAAAAAGAPGQAAPGQGAPQPKP